MSAVLRLQCRRQVGPALASPLPIWHAWRVGGEWRTTRLLTTRAQRPAPVSLGAWSRHVWQISVVRSATLHVFGLLLTRCELKVKITSKSKSRINIKMWTRIRIEILVPSQSLLPPVLLVHHSSSSSSCPLVSFSFLASVCFPHAELDFVLMGPCVFPSRFPLLLAHLSATLPFSNSDRPCPLWPTYPNSSPPDHTTVLEVLAPGHQMMNALLSSVAAHCSWPISCILLQSCARLSIRLASLVRPCPPSHCFSPSVATNARRCGPCTIRLLDFPAFLWCWKPFLGQGPQKTNAPNKRSLNDSGGRRSELELFHPEVFWHLAPVRSTLTMVPTGTADPKLVEHFERRSMHKPRFSLLMFESDPTRR